MIWNLVLNNRFYCDWISTSIKRKSITYESKIHWHLNYKIDGAKYMYFEKKMQFKTYSLRIQMQKISIFLCSCPLCLILREYVTFMKYEQPTSRSNLSTIYSWTIHGWKVAVSCTMVHHFICCILMYN